MKKVVIITLMLCCGIISSSSAKRLRVMSYNLHNCIDLHNANSLESCAATIRNVDADVIAVQELDSMTRRINCYLMGEIARLTGYYGHYAPTIQFQGGVYGLGILSKQKALSTKFYRLPCRTEPRGLLVVEFKSYYMLCTHLSLHEKDRITSAAIIRDIISKLDKPAILAGDLNDTPDSKLIATLAEFTTILSDTKRFTFPSDKPDRCIDYIIGHGAKFKTRGYQVIYNNHDSDHLPLYVDIDIKK